MKKVIVIIIAVLSLQKSVAQMYSDSIQATRKAYEQSSKNDTATIIFFLKLSDFYRRNNYDSCIHYAKKALDQSRKIKSKKGEAFSLSALEFGLRETGDLVHALNAQFESLQLARETNNEHLEGFELNSIGNTYVELGDPAKGLEYYRGSEIKFKKVGDAYWYKNELCNISNAYEKMNLLDSALPLQKQLYADSSYPIDLRSELLLRMGNVYGKLGRAEEAMKLYKEGVSRSFPTETISVRALLYCQIAKLYEQQGQQDSSIKYALAGFQTAQAISARRAVLDAALLLARNYKASDISEAYRYQQIALNYNDSLFGAQKFRQIQLILSEEQERRQKSLEQAAVQRRQYKLIGAAILFGLIILFFAYRNYYQKRSYRLLQKQKNQITLQKEELEKTLSALKSTQAQLMHAEKMASLGELTAGIAHEIQNPLNFVNNFSEINTELIEELKGERSKVNGERDEKVEDELLNDIAENEQKIIHHGKRADAVVKGMLQHSRASTGKKEPTDINALADEYLQLSYHGLRAKDKDFNAMFETEFDESIGKIEVVPQDIGRVLLNLFNNAFYSVNEKKRQLNGTFEPIVTVTTKRTVDKVEIEVKDNGNGIPQKVVDKIFQPFFTTKPTGQGTGLGLSLSYDIIKAHGGELKVKTTEGEGAKFIIQLPLLPNPTIPNNPINPSSD